MNYEGWNKVPLNAFINFKNGKKRPAVQGNYPVYGGNGILDYCDCYNNENVVIVGRVGAYCGSVFYHKDQCWISDNAISANSKINSYILFDYYLLQSLQLNKRHIGTSQPLLTQEILNNIIVKLPSLAEQQSIATTLSCLDDKIEINNHISKTLEEMAQAIFKSWFVDFEPFQDGEFVDSELGRIPQGWKVGSLLDIANYQNGLAMQKFRPKADETGIPVLKIKELRLGYCDESSDKCTNNLDMNYIVNDGDVIFSWSGSLLVDFWCGGLCGLNQHLFKVTSAKYDKWFYYTWTCFHLQKFIAIAAGKATTMGHIKREDLAKSFVLIPDEHDYQVINSIMKPLYSKIVLNRTQNFKITKMRDALLPKLMTGEIQVPVEE